MANKEVAAIRRALSDRMNNVETTPQKRSLGTIVLYPTAFQCPWADRVCKGEICDDGVTINYQKLTISRLTTTMIGLMTQIQVIHFARTKFGLDA